MVGKDSETLNRLAYFLHEPYPQAEHHAVEEVFEDVIVQNVEPIGMLLNKQRDEKYTEYIERVAANPS